LATASLASTPSAPGDVAPDGASTASGQAAGELPPNLTLVVEDDAGWRSVLSELLTDAGYQVRLCSSYGEALGCLRREKYGLAVVDLSLSNPLPGARSRASIAPEQNWDGYRLLFSIRAAGIPAMVVSGLATPTDIERAYAEHGIFAYLEKQTFDRRIFIRTVDEARAARRPRGELDALTDREREVLELLARGLTNREIADALVITTNTVKRHLKAIFQKLEIHTRTAAAAKAISVGLAGGRSP
jgi:DNA-binding NarL/FixJ family response regulator